MRAPLPPDETDRLAALQGYEVLDTCAEKSFDRLSRLAAKLIGGPAALITLIDRERQFVKSAYGPLNGNGHRDMSFCAHTILSPDPLVVRDATLDHRFYDNPNVIGGPGIRFYAGVPLQTPEGSRVGALCVIDFVRRAQPSADDITSLKELAEEVVAQLEFRRSRRDLTSLRKALKTSSLDLAATRNLWQKMEQRAAIAMESGRMGLWEWDAETDLMLFSPLLQGLLEFQENEFAGTMASWLERIHPDDRDMVLDEVRKARRLQEICSFKYRVNMCNGSERWITTTGRHKFDENGNFEGAQGVSWDCTENEISGRQLKMSEELFRGLLAASPVGVCRSDLDGNLTYVNPDVARCYEMPEQDLLGSGWLQRVHPEDRKSIAAEWAAANHQGQEFEREFRLLFPDGRVRWLRRHSVILRDPVGQPIGTVASCVDITEGKRVTEELLRAKEAAEQASRTKDIFLANMSHELRTPLNGVLGMTDLLLDSPLTSEQQEMAQIIRASGESLLAVVTNLLDLSRIEAGDFSVENRAFHLQENLANAVSMLEADARKKGLDLVLKCSRTLPPKYVGDPYRLKQVLVHYLSNAIKFSDQGVITIEADGVQEWDGKVALTIAVHDHGVGIPQEAQGLLFQPFSQVDPTSTRRHGGAGLGLALSRRLTELMGGSTGVCSTPGQGSTFWMRLTLSVAETPQLSHT